MDDVHESEQLPVYHAEEAEWVAALVGGVAPRLFALVREDYGEDDAVVEEVVAYGIALPNGSAATVLARGSGFGRWISPRALRGGCARIWCGSPRCAEVREAPDSKAHFLAVAATPLPQGCRGFGQPVSRRVG